MLDAFGVEKDARGNANATTDGEGCYATSVPKVFAAGDAAPRPVARRLGDSRRPSVRPRGRRVPDGSRPNYRAESCGGRATTFPRLSVVQSRTRGNRRAWHHAQTSRRTPSSSAKATRTDGLFIVLEGRVKVFVSDDEGHEVILGTHGPGEYFGEMALLDTGPRSASVITIEPCQLLSCRGTIFASSWRTTRHSHLA